MKTCRLHMISVDGRTSIEFCIDILADNSEEASIVGDRLAEKLGCSFDYCETFVEDGN